MTGSNNLEHIVFKNPCSIGSMYKFHFASFCIKSPAESSCILFIYMCAESLKISLFAVITNHLGKFIAFLWARDFCDILEINLCTNCFLQAQNGKSQIEVLS